MFIVPKSGTTLLAASLILSGLMALGRAPNGSGQSSPATGQAASEQKKRSPEQKGVRSAEIPDLPEEPSEDEFAPAAFEMDVSQESPLLQVLYKATRETKEKDVLARLEEAKALIQSGTDLKATDPQGRTALHWTVFGSSYSTKSPVTVAYEEIADAMIQRGIDINHEDIYQDTALDYLLYSPSFEMQTLLMENGATSGFLVATFRFFDQMQMLSPASNVPKAVSLSRRADLSPGATLSVRLITPVYSDRSRTGDPIEGVVTYPLCKEGERLVCKDGELLVPPGTKVNGTILFATKAPDKYSRPRLVLDFSNVVHKDGQVSPLYARVLDVDNARETIRNNEILGIIQPHASKKASLVFAAMSASNPFAGYAIKGISTVYGLSIRREILFPSGTDLQIQIVRPSMLKQKEAWPGFPQLTLDTDLNQIVTNAPLRTTATNKTPSDLTNLIFIGSKQRVTSAFTESHWIEADDLGVKAALKVAQATMRNTGYNSAPVSTLLLNGQPPDLVFQKSLNTFAKRHHIRIWKLKKTYKGQDVWVGAATHDIATENGRGYTKWTHRIDPHVDRERDWIQSDLLFSGIAIAYADIDRPHAPKRASNATGDEIVTDGKITVVDLGTSKEREHQGPALVQRSAGETTK
jgi:LssY C-terminus